MPFSRADMKSAGFGEMLRIIKEVAAQAEHPAIGVGELARVVAACSIPNRELARLVRGELDWIVMKCLEKDRSRRYETANGLSMDIQRYLADVPVAAGPPSATYRLRKFVKKHRGPVVAGLTVLLLLVLGIAGTSWGLVEALAAHATERKRPERRKPSEQRANAAPKRMRKPPATTKPANASTPKQLPPSSRTISWP